MKPVQAFLIIALCGFAATAAAQNMNYDALAKNAGLKAAYCQGIIEQSTSNTQKGTCSTARKMTPDQQSAVLQGTGLSDYAKSFLNGTAQFIRDFFNECASNNPYSTIERGAPNRAILGQGAILSPNSSAGRAYEQGKKDFIACIEETKNIATSAPNSLNKCLNYCKSLAGRTFEEVAQCIQSCSPDSCRLMEICSME